MTPPRRSTLEIWTLDVIVSAARKHGLWTQTAQGNIKVHPGLRDYVASCWAVVASQGL